MVIIETRVCKKSQILGIFQMYVSLKLAYKIDFFIKRIAAMDSRLDFESERVSPVFLVRSTFGPNRA